MKFKYILISVLSLLIIGTMFGLTISHYSSKIKETEKLYLSRIDSLNASHEAIYKELNDRNQSNIHILDSLELLIDNSYSTIKRITKENEIVKNQLKKVSAEDSYAYTQNALPAKDTNKIYGYSAEQVKDIHELLIEDAYHDSLVYNLIGLTDLLDEESSTKTDVILNMEQLNESLKSENNALKQEIKKAYQDLSKQKQVTKVAVGIAAVETILLTVIIILS